ncbi:MAG: porin [Rhodocyclaceae bacterium]|nr:porin [Rhodocyclaceae bacterium]
MQKKIIALAIAGLASSAAFAQTNVTVYGKIDMSYEHSSGTGGSKTTGINSGGHDGSRLGFRGEEALGGGMKAIFGLEYGSLKADTNAGITGSRQSYVGLSGNFGTIIAGNIYATGANWAGKYDSLDAANSYSPLQYFNGNFGATINPYATQNSVGYTSPSMSGFTLRGVVGFAPMKLDTVAFNTNQERLYGVGVDYDMGPLSVGVVHHRVNHIGNTGPADQRENAVAATYDFGPLALTGTWQTMKSENAAGATNADFNIKSIGMTVPVTKNDLLRLMYARFDNKMAGAAANDDANSWGVVFEHSLSKRTIGYAGYNKMNNKGAATFKTPAGNGNGGVTNATVAPGGDSNGYGFGVIHNF